MNYSHDFLARIHFTNITSYDRVITIGSDNTSANRSLISILNKKYRLNITQDTNFHDEEKIAILQLYYISDINLVIYKIQQLGNNFVLIYDNSSNVPPCTLTKDLYLKYYILQYFHINQTTGKFMALFKYNRFYSKKIILPSDLTFHKRHASNRYDCSNICTLVDSTDVYANNMDLFHTETECTSLLLPCTTSL